MGIVLLSILGFSFLVGSFILIIDRIAFQPLLSLILYSALSIVYLFVGLAFVLCYSVKLGRLIF